MQLKMSRDKKQWTEYLSAENDYMTFLLEAFQVPETVESASDDDGLLDIRHKKQRLLAKNKSTTESAEEVNERAELVRKKLEQRKATKKKSSGGNKDDKKKMKLEKVQNSQLKRALATEAMVQGKSDKKIKLDPGADDAAAVAKTGKKVFNKEGKLFFSKVEMEGIENKKNKGKDTNPVANLKKIKSNKRKIRELIDSGDKLKAKDEKQKILWQSAFDKTEGVKVKDNEETLKKTIKKRKIIKKKSKEQWIERKKKVEEKQSVQQKKREDNINKRKTDKQKTIMKKAIKLGRKF